MTTEKFDTTDAGIEKYYENVVNPSPRVAVADINDSIESVIYYTAFDGYMYAKTPECSPLPENHKLDMHLFCTVMLKCGFTVTGENICVSRGNYNRKMAEQMAYEQAFSKLWPHFGFELSRRLHREKIA